MNVMIAILSLIRGFLQSGALVFRGSEKTTAIVFDKFSLTGMVSVIGVAILLWMAFGSPFAWNKYGLIALGSGMLLSTFCAFNAVVITSKSVQVTFHYSLFFRKTKPILDSGGHFAHDPIGGEVLYTEPQLVVRGKLLVPIRLHAFFSRHVAKVLNEEIIRVSGIDLPKASVEFSS